MPVFRLIANTDFAAVMAIQKQCYSALLLESAAIIRERLLAAADSTWVVEDETLGVCAYLFAYRSTLGKVTPINAGFETANPADCLYLHDLAVVPPVQRMGLGTRLVELALSQAKAEGLRYSSLVAVQFSAPFWQRMGYEVWQGLDAGQSANLKSYRCACEYRVKILPN